MILHDNTLIHKILTAKGPEDIVYIMIKKLPLKGKWNIINIYNTCLNGGTFSKS